ncbi:hypothetical protein [Nocardia amamiensis]
MAVVTTPTAAQTRNRRRRPLCLREMAHRGELPGVHRSSW